MKSHELAKILLANPDVELLIQRDAEGNGYEEFRGIDYDIVFTEDGDVYSSNWTADEADADEEEWEQMKKDGSGFAVLYP